MSKKIVLLFLLIPLLVQPAFSQDYMSNAKHHYKKGNYPTAIIHLKNQLKNDPEYAQARYLLGDIYFKTKKFKFAEKELDNAYQLKPDNDKYRLAYARILLLNQNFKKATALSLAEFDDSALDGERLNILATAYYSQKQYEQAAYYYQQSVNKDYIKANIGLAEIAIVNENLKEAALYVNTLINKEPNNLVAWKIKALVLNLSKEHQQALEIYTRLIDDSVNNKNNSLYLERAATLMALNQFSEAEKDINLVLKENKNHAEATFFMAKLRFLEKNYQQAATLAEKILNTNDKHKPSLFISARANFFLGKLNQAEKRYHEYLSLEPDNIEIHNLLADVYFAQNKADNVVLILEALPAKHKNNISALKNLAIAYLSMGQFDKAIKRLQQAQKDKPENKLIKKLLRSIKMQAIEIESMMKELKSSSEIYRGEKRANYLLLAVYFQQNKFTKFEKQLDQLINTDPDDPNLYILQAKLELYNKNNKAAKALFNKALKYDEQHSIALARLANLAYKEHDYPLSQLYYKKILTIDKNYIKAYQVLSQLAEKRGDLLIAENYLQQAYNISKGNVTNKVRRAIALLDFYNKNKMPAKKEAIAQQLLKDNPDNVLALSLVFDIQMNLEQYQQAEVTIRKLINKDNKNVKYHILLANLLTKQPGQKEELYRVWDEANKLEPDNPIALAQKYKYQLRLRDYKSALFTAKQIRKQLPLSHLAAQMEAKAYFLLGNSKQALVSYQQAYQILATGKVAIKIADLMIMHDSTSEALDFLRKQVNKQFINQELILFRLAELYQIKKHYRQAIDYYQQLLIKNPIDIILLNNLAWIYMLLDDPKAITLIEKAYRIKPNSANIIDTYGTILLHNFKVKKAIDILSKGADIAPLNNNIQFHLAKAYYLQGNNSESLIILEEITRDEYSFSEKESAKELLQKMSKSL